ncbi:MAG: PKD domain-containing protein, partial [Chitinophagales bacterium]
MKKKYTYYLIILFFGYISYAQNYTMSNGANGTTSTCSGTFKDNGNNGVYSNNQNSTITFCPSTPGTAIMLTFTQFNTEESYDVLEVFQGNSATGTPSDVLTGSLTTPFTLVSNSPDGCISFHFESDSSVTYSGWSATISCIEPCTPPIAQLNDTSTVYICSPNAENPGNTTVSFDASPSYSPVGNTISSYEWDWGDGTTTTTTSATTTHTFPTSGIYNVYLTVYDDNPVGCSSTNSMTQAIKVLPDISFTGTSSTLNIGCGDSATLTGVATSQAIIEPAPAYAGGTVSLPDGSGVNYSSTLDFNGYFPSGATMTSGCYPTLTFDLEHSFSGDLQITLIAPTGQSVMVFNQHGGGNNFGTCSNGADNGVPGCTAHYTVVNSGGVAWTAAGVTTTATSTCATYSGACETGGNYIAQTYNSTNPFTALNGAALNGVWTLQIRDNLTWDDGFISGW